MLGGLVCMNLLNTFDHEVSKLKGNAKNAGDKEHPYIVYEEKDVNQFIEAVGRLTRQPKRRNEMTAADQEFREHLITLKIEETRTQGLKELHAIFSEIYGKQ
jgi:hypothetical protein